METPTTPRVEPESSPTRAPVSPLPRRHGTVGRMFAPLREARGVPRVVVWIGVLITASFLFLAVFAPLVAPYDFDQYRTTEEEVRFQKQAPPSKEHPFGTNVMSTDVASRVVFGARTAIEVVVLSLVLSMMVGLPLGLMSGYFGGKLDRVLLLIMDALIAFPSLLLAIVIAFLLSETLGRGVVTAALAITIVYIPQYYRVVRNHVISVREEPYVEAARSIGARPRTVIRRYVLQNVIQNVPVIATLNAADAILTLAALGFLGYGIQPTEAAEWGYDIQRAIADAGSGIWWTGLFPGLAIVLLVTGLTLLGEGLNDVVNPVLRKRAIQPVTFPSAGTVSDPTVVAGESVIEVVDLRVWYGTVRGAVRAVDGVSFEIRAGETLGLVGESGCGKSTLGRGLMGLLPVGAAVQGRVLFEGRDLVTLGPTELRELRGPEIGMVFQEPMTRLNPLMRIEDHFREMLKTHEPDMSDAKRKKRSLEALGGMGIPPTRFRQYPHEFSGGMRQRIMIALALVLRPKLVVCDEPTTALDVLVEAQIIQILSDLKRNFDTSLLLITHNLGIVAEACDRVSVMYAGRIVEEGDTRAILATPKHPYTRELLRSVISLQTTGLQYIPGAPPDLIDPPSGCRFHPRCPDAMRVCSEKIPVDQQLALDHRVQCWLHGPTTEIPTGGTQPLESREFARADEA